MSDESKWYVLRVISGKERKVKEYIENEVSRSKWTEIIKQVMIPTEKVYNIKNGKKVIKERNFFPGYVLIEADEHRMHGDMLQTIRNVTGVINFLGGTQPQALRKAEVNRILGKVDEMAEAGLKINEPYLVGETVKITDGPFNDFNGVVEEVNEEKEEIESNRKDFWQKNTRRIRL